MRYTIPLLASLVTFSNSAVHNCGMIPGSDGTPIME